MIDVVALGELLIDFAPHGQSKNANELLEAAPGGAPGNVLVMLSKLKKKTAFIGKVGNDHFGKMLKETLENAGIASGGLCFDPNAATTLAFVHLDKCGERSFSFYRSPGADTRLEVKDLDEAMLKSCRIFHFGSLSLTNEPARSATKAAVAAARDAGALISFDPNLRPPLWKSQNAAKRQIFWGAGQCDIMKVSAEELVFLTGYQSVDAGAVKLQKRFANIRLLLVTMGKMGSAYYYGNISGRKPTYNSVKTIDTTGAGDTFLGAMLFQVLECGIDKLTKAYLDESLSFANAAASLVTARKGALKSMPDAHEILTLMRKGS